MAVSSGPAGFGSLVRTPGVTCAGAPSAARSMARSIESRNCWLWAPAPARPLPSRPGLPPIPARSRSTNSPPTHLRSASSRRTPSGETRPQSLTRQCSTDRLTAGFGGRDGGAYAVMLQSPMPEEPARPDVTRLLREWQAGSGPALERLIPLVYDELHTLASRYLSRERRDHTLQTTALVNEAFLKLAGQREVDWQSRAHFFGIAAKLMRRILVDHARRGGRVKRGGGATHIPLDDVDPPAPAPDRPCRRLPARHGARAPRSARPAAGACRRAALLRWHDDRGNGGGDGPLPGHHQARVGRRQGLAVPGVDG